MASRTGTIAQVDDALDDTGLLVRYYVDEAASGTAPTAVVDAGPLGYDLTTIDYGGGDLQYVEDGGNRGLDSSTVDDSQRALRQMLEAPFDPVRDALTGAQKLCIEIVVNPRAGSFSNARLFCVNDRTGSAPDIGLAMPASGSTIALFWEGNEIESFEPTADERIVLHVVIDTTQGTQDDRIKFYVDGSQIDTTNAMGLNDTLVFQGDGTGRDLTLFNRSIGGTFNRSPDATIYYAALYTGDFDAARVADHAAVLAADDDTPGDEGPPPGGTEPVFLMPHRVAG